MPLTYTPACKFAQNFDAMLIYDSFPSFCFIYGDHACISSILQEVSLLKTFVQCWFMTSSILLFHIRWPWMHLTYAPACKFAQNFDAMLIYDSFPSFCFIYGDHACISSILQEVSLLKTFVQCWFMTSSILLFHIRWQCMHIIYTPACKFAQNFDAMLIYDSFCFTYGDHACISSILQLVGLLKALMQCWFVTSYCFIYGDHACISSILQEVSLLKTFVQCWFMTSSILLFHIRWPCMHIIYTPACKFAQNIDAVLICDSFCLIYGDHACLSSILQLVGLLKACCNVDLWLPIVSYTVTMHASHLYCSL